MIFRKIVWTVGSLVFAMLASTALAQKEAAAPDAGTAPAPAKPADETPTASKDKSQDAKAEPTENVRQRRSTKANDKSSEKSSEKDAPCIRLLELSGQYVDLVQPMGLDPASLLMGGDSLKQKSFYKLCDYLEAWPKKRKSRT